MTYQFLESVSFVPFWGGDQLEKIFFEMLKKKDREQLQLIPVFWIFFQ